MLGHNHNSRLRVFVSGSAAHRLQSALGNEHEVSLLDRSSVNGTPVDVSVHVLDGPGAGLDDAARELRERAGVPLILAVYGEPNGIVEAGLRLGAADVLVLPQPAETVVFALRKAALAAAGRDPGTVVTVFSPKGGTGKTVLATNLAAACAMSGLSTLLVDFDLQFGDAALTLAVAPKATISDLAASSGRVDADKLNAFVSSDPRTGLALLAAPKRPEEAEVVGQDELAGVLQAARAAYDAIVIDTGPLFDRAVLAAIDHTDRLLLLCTPEVTSLKNVRLGLETIDRLGFPRERMSLVANRVGARGGIDPADIERTLDAKIAYELPDDAAVPAAINRAQPVVIGDGASKFAGTIAELRKDVFAAATADPAPAARERRLLLRGRR